MSKQLFGHTFSSYTWKALIPFYETGTPFDFRMIGPDQPDNMEALAAAWPIAKFPVLLDGDEEIIEASIIVEHVAPAMIPADPAGAREVRMLDRIFDNHVMGNMQVKVAEHLPHLNDVPDQARIDRATAALDLVYVWLDTRLAGREWAAGDDFTLADCAAAPSLFYADWVRPIPEARPYRHFFPLRAPDRD